MRTCAHIVLLAVVTTSCTVENRAGSAADTSAKSPAPAADSTPAAPPPVASAWTVTPTGIGPIQVGMTVDDLRRIGGDVSLPAGAGTECVYVRPSNAPRGVAVMLASGLVARVDVDSIGVRSDAGIAVGDSAARIGQAYAGRVTTMPHKYVQGGQYLVVRSGSPADSTLRIVFESEAGRITRFRSGRVPEVEFVERCG